MFVPAYVLPGRPRGQALPSPTASRSPTRVSRDEDLLAFTLAEGSPKITGFFSPDGHSFLPMVNRAKPIPPPGIAQIVPSCKNFAAGVTPLGTEAPVPAITVSQGASAAASKQGSFALDSNVAADFAVKTTRMIQNPPEP